MKKDKFTWSKGSIVWEKSKKSKPNQKKKTAVKRGK